MTDEALPEPSATRFCLLFLGLVALAYLATSTAIAEQRVQQPLCELVARLSAMALSWLGRSAAEGVRLQFEGFSVIIIDACNGLLPATIYIAAVLAFPSRWTARLWGVLLGAPLILLLNVGRVVTLMLLGVHWPAVFEEVHMYVWQTLIVALSIGIWILWAELFARRPSVA